MKKTKIVATVGPATESPELIAQMIKSGVNVFRLNFSHGSHEEHGARLKNIRRISKELGVKTAVLADLQGPKIRTGVVDTDLIPGQKVVLACDEAGKNEIPVQYARLSEDVSAGDVLLLDDGLLELKVLSVKGKKITVEVVVGGHLSSNKGINSSTASFDTNPLTAKDIADAKFALESEVDYIALSFVREAENIRELRAITAKSDHPYTGIIAKIERHEAIKNIDEIIEEADAIMVARGDMGVELPSQEVPLLQKQIIKKCITIGKPVIVATQMLDSMIRNPRPTRAETSDIANAILDGADAVMLSGETATGAYPLEAIKTMSRIAHDTEKWVEEQETYISSTVKRKNECTTEAVAKAAVYLTETAKSKFIVAATMSGNTAKMIAKYRPNKDIIAVTESDRAANRLCLVWGVIPHVFHFETNTEMLRGLGTKLVEVEHAKPGDTITVVSGRDKGKMGGTNIIRLYHVE